MLIEFMFNHHYVVKSLYLNMVFFQTENLQGATRLIDFVKLKASKNKIEKKSIVQVHI